MENSHNQGVSKASSTGVQNVSFRRDNQKYQAYICVNWKLKHLGFYDDIRRAEVAVLKAKIEHHLAVLPRYVERLEKSMEELSQEDDLENVASD